MPLTTAAFLALAMQCAPAGMDPHLLQGIAQVESGLNPSVVSKPNRNGTYDAGLMQINSDNFAWLGLTPETALLPCASIRAAAEHLQERAGPGAKFDPATVNAAIALSRSIDLYNHGDPTYRAKVLSATERAKSESPQVAPTPACTAPDPTGWHVRASDCRVSSVRRKSSPP